MRLLSTAVIAALLLAAAPARADDEPKTRAQTLFQRGLAAMDGGDAARGCGMLRESLGLFAVPNTLFLVAQCDEQEGKLGTALAHWKRGLSLLDAKDKRAAKAKEQIAALDAKAPRLRVVLPAGQAAPQLTLDGADLDPAALEAPLVVDPGKHVLRVRAPGREDRTHEVTLAAGERTEIVAALGPVASGPTAPPKVDPPRVEPPRVEPPKVDPPREASAGAGLRAGGYVTLGVAGAAFVVAGITGGMILSRKAEAESGLPGKCTQQGSSWVCDKGYYTDSVLPTKSLLTPNTIAWGVGLAAAATGAALVIVGVRAGKASPVTAAPLITRDGGGVWLTGRF